MLVMFLKMWKSFEDKKYNIGFSFFLVYFPSLPVDRRFNQIFLSSLIRLYEVFFDLQPTKALLIMYGKEV